jgi:glutamate/tyrosine decarboxylase-like PLP-dependent enzyme
MSNVFQLGLNKVNVDPDNREVTIEAATQEIQKAKAEGRKYFIVYINMMTTMFGSVDNIDNYIEALKAEKVEYRIHVDGAFGGFYYPFSAESSKLTFKNKEITSFTLDAHKMAQAPYGTGIFLIRKNYIHYTDTQEASYVEGADCTLIGSRSGANVVAVWMILCKNGPFGWKEKIFILQKRTDWMCEELAKINVEFYRHKDANIITIKSPHVSQEIVEEFGLVPDSHSDASWFKIVIMEHVTIEKLMPLIDKLKIFNKPKS